MDDATKVIELLGLSPLPLEGGFFKETYKAEVGAATKEPRSAMTCIYYMMRGGELSRWHKVASDEIWLYHAGSSARQLLLFPDGSWTERVIGPDVRSGERPQSLIPAGTWQAAALSDRSAKSWGLFGAVVCPGFEYADFQEGDAKSLAKSWPGAASRMEELGLV